MILGIGMPCLADAPERPEAVLIIDPGHGGLDGGAVSAEGICESGINLAIAQKIDSICHLFRLRTKMTRRSEDLDYPEKETSVRAKKVWDLRRRAELANQTAGAVLLSIHQNYYPDSRPSGSQVFYGHVPGSEVLGSMIHDALISALCPENRRVAAPVSDSNYLMNSVNCPAILVECGFLSNSAEAACLTDDSYQTKLAAVIAVACIQSLN